LDAVEGGASRERQPTQEGTSAVWLSSERLVAGKYSISRISSEESLCDAMNFVSDVRRSVPFIKKSKGWTVANSSKWLMTSDKP